jgi:hypothetical protein
MQFILGDNSMGYPGDIMHDIVLKELKRNYPASEGWVISGETRKIGNDEVFSLSKRRGINQVASVGVSFEKQIDNDLVSDLKVSAGSAAARKAAWHASVIVPQGAEVTNAVPGMKILYMRSFRYEGKDLQWLKRPVGNPVVSQPPQASS